MPEATREQMKDPGGRMGVTADPWKGVEVEGVKAAALGSHSPSRVKKKNHPAGQLVRGVSRKELVLLGFRLHSEIFTTDKFFVTEGV